MMEMKLSPTVEDYLQAIYSLEGEGETVKSARLAHRMRVTPPTAWATVRRMARDGLVELDGKKVIHLTQSGRSLAESIVRRHRLAERFLVDILKLGWADVHEQAHHFEHGITPQLEERMLAILDNPQTCPHGSPIPGSGATIDPSLVPLITLAPGTTAIVRFISEELEEDGDLLHYLERSLIMPGRLITVQEVLPSNGVIIIRSGNQDVPLGMGVANRIRVQVTRAAAVGAKDQRR